MIIDKNMIKDNKMNMKNFGVIFIIGILMIFIIGIFSLIMIQAQTDYFSELEKICKVLPGSSESTAGVDCVLLAFQQDPSLIKFNELPLNIFNDPRVQKLIPDNLQKYSTQVLGGKFTLIKGDLASTDVGFKFTQDGKLTLQNNIQYDLNKIPLDSTVTINKDKILIQLKDQSLVSDLSGIVQGEGRFAELQPGKFFLGDNLNPVEIKGNLLVDSQGNLFIPKDAGGVDYSDGKQWINIKNNADELVNFAIGKESSFDNSVSFLDDKIIEKASANGEYNLNFGDGKSTTIGGNGLNREVTLRTANFGNEDNIYRYKGTIDKSYDLESVNEIQRAVNAKVDGLYGEETKAKVLGFQETYNQEFGGSLQEDGYWGPQTRDAWEKVYGDNSIVESPSGKSVNFFRDDTGLYGVNVKGTDGKNFLTGISKNGVVVDRNSFGNGLGTGESININDVATTTSKVETTTPKVETSGSRINPPTNEGSVNKESDSSKLIKDNTQKYSSTEGSKPPGYIQDKFDNGFVPSNVLKPEVGKSIGMETRKLLNDNDLAKTIRTNKAADSFGNARCSYTVASVLYEVAKSNPEFDIGINNPLRFAAISELEPTLVNAGAILYLAKEYDFSQLDLTNQAYVAVAGGAAGSDSSYRGLGGRPGHIGFLKEYIGNGQKDVWYDNSASNHKSSATVTKGIWVLPGQPAPPKNKID